MDTSSWQRLNVREKSEIKKYRVARNLFRGQMTRAGDGLAKIKTAQPKAVRFYSIYGTFA